VAGLTSQCRKTRAFDESRRQIKETKNVRYKRRNHDCNA